MQCIDGYTQHVSFLQRIYILNPSLKWGSKELQPRSSTQMCIFNSKILKDHTAVHSPTPDREVCGKESEGQKWENLSIKLLFNKWRKKKKKKIPNDAELITCHQQINAKLKLFWKISYPSPVFIAEHVVTWYGISVWLIQVSCLGCVPSQPLAHPHPTCYGVRARNRGGLDALQALFSNN